MRYIRVENGIYKVFEEMDRYFVIKRGRGKLRNHRAWMPKTTFSHKPLVYKLADAPEELFDCLVIVCEGQDPRVYQWYNEEDKKWLLSHIDIHVGKWLGCIWKFDKKGNPVIKPVAEINEKREWELL